MPDGRRWKCFGCGKSGDAIDWLRERQGLQFREACLALDSGSVLSAPRQSVCSDANTTVAPKQLPDDDWQKRAEGVIGICSKALLSADGDRARAWLNARGLRDETLSKWRLGYNSQDQSIDGHFISQGIVIPWRDSESARCIKIRRSHSNPKYVCVQGSCPSGVYLSEAIKAGYCTLVVEGEFDALLGWQQAGDFVNVVTLGSASSAPDRSTLIRLSQSPLILVCYDNDPAGQRGADRWASASKRVRHVRLPFGKDLTEFHIEGGDVRVWVESLLSAHLTHRPDTRQFVEE